MGSSPNSHRALKALHGPAPKVPCGLSPCHTAYQAPGSKSQGFPTRTPRRFSLSLEYPTHLPPSQTSPSRHFSSLLCVPRHSQTLLAHRTWHIYPFQHPFLREGCNDSFQTDLPSPDGQLLEGEGSFLFPVLVRHSSWSKGETQKRSLHVE